MGRSRFAPSGVSYFANFTEHECAVVNDGNSGWACAAASRLEDIQWDNERIKELLERINKDE